MTEMEYQNITFRSQRTKQLNESLNISFVSTASDYLARSLPDLSTVQLCDEDSEYFKEQILKLQEQLQIAHAKIDNLNSENSNLKQRINEHERKIPQLKQISAGSPQTGKTTASLKMKKKQKLQEKNSNVSVGYLGLKTDYDNRPTDGDTSDMHIQQIICQKYQHLKGFQILKMQQDVTLAYR
ncbi:unnamed protein product [Arctia plantaginis]|uniref:Uncharacterized protein n=1 Tax=Arctia plantaginis TaxID=874455 RepID=A0A8S0ZZ78_ARCPL|nr:unnamed protein product [Arctia plantaginis]